ncbi:MAG: aldo/keto reductase [Prevotellaceae bacterium]|jgi:alcohol dehydrogenase (NADP+)|nr:aldo/keto reductase [Prevotellaceae bacterium]
MNPFTFKNADTMPALGIGTWRSQPDEVYEAVLEALRAGYRHIDCAQMYKNEREVGQALDYAFRFGIVKRSEIFITSKLWNSDHAPARVEEAINRSLANLQLKYLDLYLIHWPVAQKEGTEFPSKPDDLLPIAQISLAQTWRAMIEVQRKALAVHIGVSNFNIPKINDLAAQTKLVPEVNQVEIHPYFQQNELVDFCNKKGIIVTAYSPFGGKIMADKGIDIKKDAAIVSIAKKHGATPAQVILAWNIKRGIAVIPKSVSKSRIVENIGTLNVKLSREDMQQMAQLDRNMRVTEGALWTMKGSPYTSEWLWEQ